MSAWRCHVCLQLVSPADRIEKRIEYRTAQGHRRYRVVTVAHLCRGCADSEVGLLRPAGAEQERLW